MPAVSAKTLEQWQHRGLVEMHNLGLGRGRPATRIAADALQVSTLAELAGLGVPLGYGREAWLIVRERAVGGALWAGVLIAQHPETEFMTVRPFGEAARSASCAPSAIRPPSPS